MHKLIRIFCILFAISLSSVSVFSQKITGAWSGTLNYGEFTLPIVFHIEEKDGIYITTMDSPFEGVKGFKTSATVLKNKKLTINIPKSLAVFKGKVKKNSIEGTFTQRGKVIPLVLTRGEVEFKRPQDPQKPFPYNSENVYFENEKAGITLAGTLTYPKIEDKFPAVVLITGSGPQNRDSELLGHRPFAVLADYLTRNGIAVLRYDDRGVGESQGIFRTASILDFATDALAAVSYLKTRNEIDHNKIGLIGHSEGGSVAFVLAGGDNDLAFIVSMAGATVRGDTLMKLQRYFLSKAAGLPDKHIEENEALVMQMYQIIEKHTVDSVFKYPDLFVDEVIPAKMKKNTLTRDAFKSELAWVASPSMQFFLSYDPAEDLQKIKCPVLALNGDKDLQVPADITLNTIQKWVTNNLSVKKYPDLNHLFQHAKTGLPNEYGIIEETLSPEVLEDILLWLNEMTK